MTDQPIDPRTRLTPETQKAIDEIGWAWLMLVKADCFAALAADAQGGIAA